MHVSFALLTLAYTYVHIVLLYCLFAIPYIPLFSLPHPQITDNTLMYFSQLCPHIHSLVRSIHAAPHRTTLHQPVLHTTPHHTPHHTTLHTTPHYTTPHYTTLHYTTLHHTTLHHTTPHHTALHHTTLDHTTPHYTTHTLHNPLLSLYIGRYSLTVNV